MNKKVIAVVGLAFLLAVSGGVIALNADNNPQKTKDNTASTTASYDYTENIGGDVVEDDTEEIIFDVTLPDIEDETEEVATELDDSPIPTGYDGTVEPSVPYEEQIISASMTIQFVVDHSTGAEESPRVAFGESYKYCYASFDSDKSFEMCLDPAAGTVRRGTYAIYGNIVSVEYEDGVGSEYDILTDEYGNVTHVIVNYGDYDVYFG